MEKPNTVTSPVRAVQVLVLSLALTSIFECSLAEAASPYPPLTRRAVQAAIERYAQEVVDTLNTLDPTAVDALERPAANRPLIDDTDFAVRWRVMKLRLGCLGCTPVWDSTRRQYGPLRWHSTAQPDSSGTARDSNECIERECAQLLLDRTLNAWQWPSHYAAIEKCRGKRCRAAVRHWAANEWRTTWRGVLATYGYQMAWDGASRRYVVTQIVGR